LQTQGIEDQSAANRYSAEAISAMEFYRRQNVSSTIQQQSTSVRADGTQNTRRRKSSSVVRHIKATVRNLKINFTSLVRIIPFTD